MSGLVTENDFHKKFGELVDVGDNYLDGKRFDDWDNYAILADWLDEQGDPRGEGYRMLGTMKFSPLNTGRASPSQWFNAACFDGKVDAISDLPTLWFEKLEKGEERKDGHGVPISRTYPTMREARDDAALAWLKLSKAERKRLKKAYNVA